jgi:hypothetical protein
MHRVLTGMVDKKTDTMYAIRASAFGMPSALGPGSIVWMSAGSRGRPRCSGVGSGMVLDVAEVIARTRASVSGDGLW